MNVLEEMEAAVDEKVEPGEGQAAQVNADEIAAGLLHLHPAGALLLVWIDPMKKRGEPGQTGADTFQMPDELEAAATWAADHNNRRRNVYWTVNQVRRPMRKKPSKTDMASGIMVWSDADPKVKELGSYEAARAELEGELLPVLRQSASIIIDSGNGLQAFWRLAEPIALPDGLDVFEALNRRVGAAFDGPGTPNADRLMRLPGTINFPSPDKLKKGYPSEPSRARLLLADGPIYTRAQVEALVEARALPQKLTEYLRKHPQARARWQGGTEGLADTSGSARDMSMVQMLRFGGFTFDEVRALLLTWPHGALHRSSNPDRDLERAWSRGAAGKNSEKPVSDSGGEAAPIVSGEGASVAHQSEDQLALEFAARYGTWFRWSPGLDWMRNEGTHWTRDDERRRFSLARKVCRAAALSAGSTSKLARALSSAKTVAAVLTMSQTDERVVVPAAVWDADPWLFNTPGGVVDLRSGRMVERSDGHYLTQLAAVAPDTTREAPTWMRFLTEVFLGDVEMIEFVQRMLGYCLTGSTQEQKIFFWHGLGANGKSTLLDLFLWLLGTYAVKLPAVALMQTKIERHPTELAQLRGRRLAVSSELEEGQFWAESRIKELTGDETMTARFMRQDFFSFRMTQKHVIAGNHKPRLRGGDAAMARRFVLVPFNAKFEGTGRDPRMAEKLRAEGPAILAWAVQGAMKWHDSGLRIPGSVAHASAAYMSDFDDLRLWLSECCEVDPVDNTVSEPASELYASFRGWKQDRGEHAPSQTVWGERLGTVEGVRRYMSNGKVRYRGVRLQLDARERLMRASTNPWQRRAAT